MSGWKRRVKLKILALCYDADAQHSAVFLCDHKSKLN